MAKFERIEPGHWNAFRLGKLLESFSKRRALVVGERRR